MNSVAKALSVFVSLAAIGSGALGACSSTNAAPPCNQDPWSCPAGQTCWVGSGPDDYKCLAAGGGGDGQPCTPLVGTPGCASGLVCLSSGTCALFCDPGGASPHGCSTGKACQSQTLAGGQQSFNACTPPADGGIDTGAPPPPTDSGADTAPPPPVDAGHDSGPADTGVDTGHDSGGSDAGTG